MFSFDLKSAYHHIDIFPKHIKFLAFAWAYQDGKQTVSLIYTSKFSLTSFRAV